MISRFARYSFILILLISASHTQAQNTLEDKIGQMIMVGYAPNTAFEDSLFYDIANRNLGGVVLFAYNIAGPAQISAQTDLLHSASSNKLLVAIDQEGGVVARLDENNGYIKTESAYHLGTILNNENATRDQAALMAGWLNDAGINTNLAPVVDLNINPNSPAIGRHGRSFSPHPMLVYEHANWTIDEYKNANIITALKHFPGHGSAESDSHLGFTDVTTTWADSELIPYRELFANGYSGMVMTGHLFNSYWDPLYPASLSSNVINDLLRDSLGFNGVVISDEMFMNAISLNYGFEESIVLAINAGTDILLFSTNEYNNQSLVAEVIRIVKQKVAEGVIAENTIDESFQRIEALKNGLTGFENSLDNIIPQAFSISNYPNPFNNSTNIVVNILEGGPVQIKIFNITGQEVFGKYYSHMNAGKNIIQFIAANLSSGIYVVRVETAGKFTTGKIMLLK